MGNAKSRSGGKSPMLLDCSEKRIQNDESKRKELLFDLRYLYSYTYFRRLVVVVAVRLEKTRDILTQSTTTSTTATTATTTTATSEGETSQEYMYALSFPTAMCTNNPNKLKGGRRKHALQNIKHKTKLLQQPCTKISSSTLLCFLRQTECST